MSYFYVIVNYIKGNDYIIIIKYYIIPYNIIQRKFKYYSKSLKFVFVVTALISR